MSEQHFKPPSSMGKYPIAEGDIPIYGWQPPMFMHSTHLKSTTVDTINLRLVQIIFGFVWKK